MTWHQIHQQEHADALMRVFSFCDACLREVHLWTGHWVSKDLSMSCDSENRIRLLVQRQCRNPSAIEMLFEEVTRFNLVPPLLSQDSIIDGAVLLVREGTVYWSPDDEWSPDLAARDESTWLSAKKLRWREVDWLGEQLRYGPGREKDRD
ncbi:MAG: hypothetical protein V3T86_14390 [Planctomycetota bacterium]